MIMKMTRYTICVVWYPKEYYIKIIIQLKLIVVFFFASESEHVQWNK